jgi:hypothetical protein
VPALRGVVLLGRALFGQKLLALFGAHFLEQILTLGLLLRCLRFEELFQKGHRKEAVGAFRERLKRVV